FFRYVTKMGEIFIYLLATIAFLFYRYRYAFLVPVAGFVTLGLSLLLKNYFQSPRPVLYFKKLGMYDQINLVEGVALLNRLSFPSGHTMSAFALYGLLAFILPQKKSLGFFFFFLATLVAISRVYLTQHFFEDIYAGAILGTLIAMTIYYVQSFLSPSPDRWFNQSLGASKNKLPSENHPRP
ncbi:MAG: phosphatase PAP2 family protein, partial [Bacteroidota bacterium]